MSPIVLAAAAAQSVAVAEPIPHFDHVVIVIMENTSLSSIIGNTAAAPYINSLAQHGANFTASYAVTHPSEPNYLALFSGSTQGVTDDSCPLSFSTTPNLGGQLIAAGLSFAGYSESMPADGYTQCSAYPYARKHNPWVNFSNVPATSNLIFDTTNFPTDFTQLPTLAFVVPNLCNDMHDCPIGIGDTWLKNNLDAYVTWAKRHNSLFILTWDEDDGSTSANRIPTLVIGAHLERGNFPTPINHYNVLRTLEDMYAMPAIGSAATAPSITEVWNIFGDGFEP